MAGQIDCSREDILPECNLPGDLIVSILSNLPVKSLLKFKAVSKPWCCLISSPGFIKLHLRRQSLIANHLLMSFGDYEETIFGLLTHNHDKNNTSDSDSVVVDSDVLILEGPKLFSSKVKSFCIFDSCNGLVCLFARSWDLSLWNPATRKHRSVELPKGVYRLSYITVGLCYVEATSDFKILGWNDTHTHLVVNKPSLFVYSLSSDSWEKFDYDAKNVPVDIKPPTFMNGCMHWLMDTGGPANVIVAFDVTDGVISCFGGPDDCGSPYETLRRTLVIRGCLSIVIILHDFEDMESGSEVWVMEEYGVEGSWVKRFFIQGLTQVLLPSLWWNDSEIIFTGKKAYSNILTFYDPFSKKKYFLEFKSFNVSQVVNYVESLASVEAKAEIAPFQLVRGLI